MFILEYLESIKEALIKLKWCNICNILINWKWKSLSLVRLFATPGAIYSPWNSPGQNTGMVSCSLLQGIFPTQGSNPYQLEPPGKPKNTGVGILSLLQWSSHPGIEPALQADWFIMMMCVKMCAFWYVLKNCKHPYAYSHQQRAYTLLLRLGQTNLESLRYIILTNFCQFHPVLICNF